MTVTHKKGGASYLSGKKKGSGGCSGTTDIPVLSTKKDKSIVPSSKSSKAQEPGGSAFSEDGYGGAKAKPAISSAGKPLVKEKVPQHVLDVDTLSPTPLRKMYPLTASSHRNMKARAKTHGAIIAPEFEDFASFLKIQGPRPSAEFTLDRLDNDNPTYGPELCCWRDKGAQANNKSTTIYLTDVDGKKDTLVHWAKITTQKPDTMRKHRKQGWSDAEVIAGKRLPQSSRPRGFGITEDNAEKILAEVQQEISEMADEYADAPPEEIPAEAYPRARKLEKIKHVCLSIIDRCRARLLAQERALHPEERTLADIVNEWQEYDD